MLLCEQQTDKYQKVACQFSEECFQTTPKPAFPYGDGSLKIQEVGRQQFEGIHKCDQNARNFFSGFQDILKGWRAQRIREMFHSAEMFRQREIEGPYDARALSLDLAWEIFSDHPKIKIMGYEIKVREYAAHAIPLVLGSLTMIPGSLVVAAIVMCEVESRFMRFIWIATSVIVTISLLFGGIYPHIIKGTYVDPVIASEARRSHGVIDSDLSTADYRAQSTQFSFGAILS